MRLRYALVMTSTTAGKVGEFARTGEFLWDVHEGKQAPQDRADWYRGLAE